MKLCGWQDENKHSDVRLKAHLNNESHTKLKLVLWECCNVERILE